MNQKELKELIEFLIEKDIAEFELERGDVKVRIKRGVEHVAAGRGGASFCRAYASDRYLRWLRRRRSRLYLLLRRQAPPPRRLKKRDCTPCTRRLWGRSTSVHRRARRRS